MAKRVNPSRNAAPTSLTTILVAVLFACVCCPCGLSIFTNSNGTNNSAKVGAPAIDTGSNYDAWYMAQKFIKDSLKSPSTASFGGGSFSEDFQDPNKCVTKAADGTYVVGGWVDSQNAFGATVRSKFVMKLRYEGNGTWAMIGPPVLLQR